jgi:23S rRNA (cytidine2498-2'-O)-methyltransferase
MNFAFACDPEWESVLADELGRVFPGAVAQLIAEGWITAEFVRAKLSAAPTVAFASQCLPDAAAIEADSIAKWVQAVGPRIIEKLSEHSGPWRLHVFGVYQPEGAVGPRRATLIENGIIELLHKKQRRLLKTRTSGMDVFATREALVQVGLVTPSSGFLSVGLPEMLERLRRCVSPFPGGIVEVPPDRRAPSRAFAKLLEAEIRLGRRIEAGETCVDLGSSPGSWAYIALGRGAKVVAVDRSPLRGDLMKHPSLEFARGDAFRFIPPAPVDWLLCDVIAFPERVFELLKRWLTERWCRRFCVTIKFRGTSDYENLEPIKDWLAVSRVDFLLRRLTSNKNEVTVAGICEQEPARRK